MFRAAKRKQLLDALIVQRSLRLLRRNCVVLNAHLLAGGVLSDGANSSHRSLICGDGGHGIVHRNVAAVVQCLISCSNAAGEPNDENRGGQGGSEANFTQPRCRIENQTPPKSALLRGFQSFLQAHARGRQQVRRWLLNRELRKRIVKCLGRAQLFRTFGAARQMLLEFVAGIVGQLVIEIQRNVLFDPFALHIRFTP